MACMVDILEPQKSNPKIDYKDIEDWIITTRANNLSDWKKQFGKDKTFPLSQKRFYDGMYKLLEHLKEVNK